MTTKELRAVFARLMDHVESLGYTEVNFSHDYYWDFSSQERYAVESSPERPEPVVGQLGDDLEMLQQVLLGSKREPLSYDLVYLAAVLRAIGEELVA